MNAHEFLRGKDAINNCGGLEVVNADEMAEFMNEYADLKNKQPKPIFCFGVDGLPETKNQEHLIRDQLSRRIRIATNHEYHVIVYFSRSGTNIFVGNSGTIDTNSDQLLEQLEQLVESIKTEKA